MARYAETTLIGLIEGSSAVTSAIDVYETYPAVFNDTIKPEDFTGDKYIMIYGSGLISLQVPINQPLTVSVRTSSRSLCTSIVSDIIDAVHRYNNDGFNFVCSPLPIIRPQDETDLYNAPINIRAQSK